MAARLDWECRGCGVVVRDHLGGAPEHPGVQQRDSLTVLVDCPDPTFEILWTSGPRLDTFQPFEFDYDQASPLGGRTVLVDSLQKLRHVERECERMNRDGAHRPVVFRHSSQDHSNRDKPIFGRFAGERPERTRSLSGIPFGFRRGKMPEGEE